MRTGRIRTLGVVGRLNGIFLSADGSNIRQIANGMGGPGWAGNGSFPGTNGNGARPRGN